MQAEAILYYLVLLDSIFANFAAWICPKWYKLHFKGLRSKLPLTKAWAAIYFILVLWVGYALRRLAII